MAFVLQSTEHNPCDDMSVLLPSSLAPPVVTELQAGKPILILILSHKIAFLEEGLILINNAQGFRSLPVSLQTGRVITS